MEGKNGTSCIRYYHIRYYFLVGVCNIQFCCHQQREETTRKDEEKEPKSGWGRISCGSDVLSKTLSIRLEKSKLFFTTSRNITGMFIRFIPHRIFSNASKWHNLANIDCSTLMYSCNLYFLHALW